MSKYKELIPLTGTIVIEPDEKEEKKGLLYVPDTAQQRSKTGKVFRLSRTDRLPDGTQIPWEIKVGDSVMYQEWQVHTINVGGKDFVLARRENLISKLQ